MERELFLPGSFLSLSPEYIEAEKRNMNQIFPYIESYSTFCTTQEVYNCIEGKIITNYRTLARIFHQLHPPPFYFTCGKN